MRFICLAYLDRGLTPDLDAYLRYQELAQAMQEAGVLVAMGQLISRNESKTVRVTNGTTHVSDGPPASDSDETSSPIAYFLLDCASPDDALSWAARLPAAEYGSIEVRPTLGG
jgi:hypothetical protein